MNNDKPDFWGKKDDISLARSLRLAITRNVFRQGMISEGGARDILSGPLSPGSPLTRFDDAEWLTKPFNAWIPDEVPPRT